MPFTGLSMLTHGWHHPGTVEVSVCETPELTAVVEVRPEIRGATTDAPAPGPAGEPVILAAEEMRPEMRGASSTASTAPVEEPKVLSASDLKPVIRGAEEE